MIRRLAALALETILPRDRFLRRGSAQCRSLALTFDDGPHPEHTPLVLDLLQQAGIRATFFVVGRAARRYPDLVRWMAAEGHAVGHLSYTYIEPPATSAAELMAEVRRSGRLVEDLIGEPSLLFRPPKGSLTWSKLRRLLRERLSIVLWNQDPRDYRMRHPREMNDWCRRYRPAAGDIVLLHDNHPYAAHAIRKLAGRPDLDEIKFARISDWLWPEQANTKHLLQLAATDADLPPLARGGVCAEGSANGAPSSPPLAKGGQGGADPTQRLLTCDSPTNPALSRATWLQPALVPLLAPPLQGGETFLPPRRAQT